ncbi:acyl-CoA N-acyltransferase [Chytriomyces sp. MP71]|nr:acyl-CoA N-acyltransferase [Chytriomyces sp. MP71]
MKRLFLRSFYTFACARHTISRTNKFSLASSLRVNVGGKDPAVRLVPWQHEMAPLLVEHFNGPDATEIVKNLRNIPQPFTLRHAELLAATFADKKCYGIVEETDLDLIGVISLTWNECGIVEVGFYLVKQWWGDGIMVSVLHTLLALLESTPVEERPFAKIYAFVNENNLASQKTLERAGFEKEAFLRLNQKVNGRFENEFLYAYYLNNS